MGPLTSLGLTDAEERAYEELVDQSSATAAELASVLGETAARLQPVLDSLVGRVLVSRVPGRPVRFVALPPEQAIEALARGLEEEVAKVRAHATVLAQRARAAAEWRNPAELVEVVEGEAIGVRVEQLQRAARREVCFFDVPPFMSPGGENPVEPERLADGVRYRAIYDRVLLDEPEHIARISRCIADGEEARTHADLPMKLMIVDHEVAVVPLMGDRQRAPTAAMFIRPSVLLDSVAAVFEVLWSRSVPLRAGFVPSAVGAVSPEVAEILGLLASGMKDEVIARHLGVNVRTVRRRIRAALDALGVATRFQAGVRAAQLGVLE